MNESAVSRTTSHISNECVLPVVSIGMPVYNSAKNIRSALDSLLSQTFNDFIIVVSDNASTDETGDIVQEYALHDSRIIYIRQSKNIGAVANFKFVFDATNTKYFMWAADDDIRSKEFLERNFNFLEGNANYLGSTLRTRFQGGKFDPVRMGDATLDHDDFATRIINFFGTWHANGRFYSLFRREALVRWMEKDGNFLGSDWTLITYLASKGKLKRIDTGWVELGKSGASNTTDIFFPFRRNVVLWLIPFYYLSMNTWSLMTKAKFNQRIILAKHLIILNLHAFLLQHKFIFNKLHRTICKYWFSNAN